MALETFFAATDFGIGGKEVCLSPAMDALTDRLREFGMSNANIVDIFTENTPPEMLRMRADAEAGLAKIFAPAADKNAL